MRGMRPVTAPEMIAGKRQKHFGEKVAFQANGPCTEVASLSGELLGRAPERLDEDCGRD